MKGTNKQPLAIVGIGCRFPGGVTSAETFWKMVSEGKDAIVDVPSNRWDYRKFFDADNKRPGKTRVKQGGYLQQPLDEFDPLFFGISPREAAFTDPQQRLLLEVVWEAFEDAGITAQALAGSNTGVFIGGFNLDNLLLQLGRDNLELISSSTAASVTMTMLSNRISYTFDLRGPSVTMDTACSSSMVSAHYACQSIWNGECDIALAGGVNIISRPEYMVSMSKGGFLSPHGRCKSFDEDAQGYVRGEGAGILVIKTLAQALADKDDIYTLIRNSGVNQDGYTQNGISFPSASAQHALMQKIYQESATAPQDVGYVEAHGTGTQAGDPIEISSLATVLAQGRSSDNPCYVGSVKSNIGHTESAAGVAGIIKAALSINKGAILPNLHFNNPNPNIDFADGRLVVPVKLMPWNETNKPRMASVNSFGYGGTNGHIILEQYCAPTHQGDASAAAISNASDTPYLFPMSAKTEKALIESCEALQTFLQSEAGQAINLADLNYSLAYRRSALIERLTIAAKDKRELEQKLAAVIRGEYPEGCARNSVDKEGSHKLVFVFTGMGPQWWGMGRELYNNQPLFRKVVDDCDEIFTRLSGWSIKREMLAPEQESRMANTQIAQPANFILQVALLELYRSWGIAPAAVVGHSVGEVASAYTSGALSLEDALTVSFHRSRLQQQVAGGGAMLAIGLGGEAAQAVADLYDLVSIAAVNSATSVTLAGDTEQLNEIAGLLESQGIFNRKLQVEVAYHSYQMDPIEAELRAALAGITPRDETLPLYSTATGQRIAGKEFNADYWWDNVRQAVSFEAAIKCLIDDGYSHFLEVGPQPVTRNFLNECLLDKQVSGRIFSSLVIKKPEENSLFESLGSLFAAGYQLNWPEAVRAANFVRLPSYPWQRESYWNESSLAHQYLFGSGEKHPFFFEKLMTPEPAWQVELNENYFPFLPEHRISQQIVFPGAAYIEAGLALQHYQHRRDNNYSLENLKFHRMLMLDENKSQQLRIVEHPDSGNFSVYASEVNSNNWTLHATGHMVAAVLKRRPQQKKLEALRANCDQVLNRDALYRTFDQRGLGYGLPFQTIHEIYCGYRCVLSRITDDALKDQDFAHYQLYPTLLDGAFQSLIALTDGRGANPMVPVNIGEITVFETGVSEFWCYGELLEQQETSIRCNLILLDNDGNTLVEINDLICMEVNADNSEVEDRPLENCFYRYEWVARDRDDAAMNDPAEDNWVIVTPHDQQDTEKLLMLVEECEERGIILQLCDLSRLASQHKKNGSVYSDSYLAELKVQFEHLLKPGRNHLLYFAGGVAMSTTELSLANTLNPCLPLIALAQSLDSPTTEQGRLVKASEALEINLNVMTWGVQPVDDTEETNAVLPAVAALTHLLGNELASIKPRHIDLSKDRRQQEREWDNLISEWLTVNADEDIALRGDQRFVKRLTEVALESGEKINVTQVASNNPDTNVAISFETGANTVNPGDDIASWTFRLEKIGLPDPSQLHLQIEKIIVTDQALNTLMGARGAKEESRPHVALSKVIAVGEGVKQFLPGDQVIALLPQHSLNSQVLVDQDLCIAHSSALSTDLALDCLAFAEALHIMGDIAGDNNDRIFIQNAFNPLGLALVQLVRSQGITVYATADNPFKRHYLQSVGVQQVFDNSDLTYIADLQYLLRGKGFGVVINNLGDEHFTHCFNLLSPGGRLIQLPVAAGQTLNFPSAGNLQPHYSYTFVDFAYIIKNRPQRLANLHTRFLDIAISGIISSLPKWSVPVTQLDALVEYFDSAESFTQAAVTFDAQPVNIVHKDPVPTINRQATYLITGGTSGLGLEIAHWLLEQGAVSIALVSRSGSSRPEAQAFVQKALLSGKNVQLFDVDICDVMAVNHLIKNITNNMLPLSSVIHCAMLLDDDLTAKMNVARMTKVMGPKVLGAINLHNATRHLQLQQFISISSISSIIGNVGQTNYVAANAFLAGFAHYRRRAGLPATTINLGVLQDVGVVSRDDDLAKILEAKGITGLTTVDVVRGLGYIFNNDPAQIGFFRVDWSAWAQESPKGASSSRFNDLVQKAKAGQDRSPALANLLQLLEHQEHYLARLMEILSNELAQIVRMPVADIKNDRSISDLGIDSLMSVELSRGLRAKYGLEVTSLELLSGPSLSQLTETLVAQLADKAVQA